MGPKKNSFLSLFEDQRYKVSDIIIKCEMIRQNYGINVYNDFNLYLSDDDRITCKDSGFDEKCCLSCKRDGYAVVQCSKSRKKGDLYCGMHKKPAEECRLAGTIVMSTVIETIKHNIDKSKENNAQKNNATTKDKEVKDKNKTIKKTSQHNSLKKDFRAISIEGELFYVKQKSLEAYDIHMTRVGTYMYDEDEDAHCIVDCI